MKLPTEYISIDEVMKLPTERILGMPEEQEKQEKFRHASRYFSTALENPKALTELWDIHVPETVKFRKPLLVGRGISGVLALGILGLHTGLPIAPVRKNMSPHSDYLIEIPPIDTDTPWIFVDDFVCSGETREAVKERVASVPQYRGRLIGSFLYEDYIPWTQVKYL